MGDKRNKKDSAMKEGRAKITVKSSKRKMLKNKR